MTLELPPHEGLVDLVQSQEDRKRSDQPVLRTTPQVQTGVHADRRDDQSKDEVPSGEKHMVTHELSSNESARSEMFDVTHRAH